MVGLACLGSIRPLAAQQSLECDAGGIEVRKLDFVGNETFPDAELAIRIETTQSSFFRRTFRVFGKRFCLDSLTVSRDSLRLIVFYHDHGFTDVKVGREIQPMGPRLVHVRFTIREGRPVVIDSVTYAGFDSVPDSDRILRGLPIETGDRFDRAAIGATRDTLSRRLRDRGYPLAEVLRSFDTDTALRRARVEFNASPGPRMRVGTIDIRIDSRPGAPLGTNPERVKSVLGIRAGQLFQQRALEGVKRGLFLTEAFQHVDVSIDTMSLTDAVDSLLTVNVRLTEGELHAARVSAGWGTYDCFRSQGSYTDYNFLHSLRRLDLNGRVSKIGTGYPLHMGDALCTSEVRDDRFSDTLNYYAGATISQPALFGLRSKPSLSLYSERRSELAVFLRDVPIGLLGSLQQEGGGRFPMFFSYQLEFGSTLAQPAYFCQVFQICDRNDQKFLTAQRRSATLGWNVVRNRANDFANPSRGSVMRAEVRHASQLIGSDPDIEFTRASIDGSVYRGFSSGGVLVLRLRAGTVLGSRVSIGGQPRYIPPQERFYAGGPNSVRGFRQNELGSLIYLVDTFTVVPNPNDPNTVFFRASPGVRLDQPQSGGGENVVVANAEVRLRSFFLPDLVQYAIFADAGDVWNRGAGNTHGFLKRLKVTPGVGARVFTAIGPVRVDIGYNPYDRPSGPSYYNVARAQSGQNQPVYCVSPTNTLPVPKPIPGAEDPPVQPDGPCPPTFTPPPRGGFFKRLTFNFSIGQPF
jgi:outer membrane protein insertion porin family